MFKHAFHGGPAVEVFSTSGKNPLEKWKVSGGGITKAFESSIKGYIYTLDGQAKMQLPKDDRECLGLVQPFLVFQIYIPVGKNLHIEIGITDSSKTKRRLIFHSGAKEMVTNPLHARIPITSFKRNQWLNLSLDIFAFAHYCFKGVLIRSIDLIIITASCKLRKIFTMKCPIYDDQEQEDQELAGQIQEMMQDEQRDNMPFEHVMKNLQYPSGFTYYNQLIFPQRMKANSSTLPDENINHQNHPEALGKKVQLAFGQRLPKHSVLPVQSTPHSKRNPAKLQISSRAQPNEDLEELQQEDFYSPVGTAKSGRRVTKEELKEETHYIEFQQHSSEEEKNEHSLERVKEEGKYNPWDIQGRKGHDRPVEKEESGRFYSPIEERQVESELTDRRIQEQQERVNEIKERIEGIEEKYKYTGEEIVSPKINREKKKFGQKGGKVPLKQPEVKKLSNYQDFNVNQWETDQQEIEFSIEEQFDINHENLMNFQNIKQERSKSKDKHQNPLYIEFELNNDDDEPVQQEAYNTQQTEPMEVNHYDRLESSRKEERRPFSPPFKFQQPIPLNLENKTDYLKVQKTQILRDSLDMCNLQVRELQSDMPAKATVENEAGEVLEVIFDPILQCYYDPKENTYYELKL